MKCPKCHESASGVRAKAQTVIDSRDVGEGEAVRRRRECPHCQLRFTTYERVEPGSWEWQVEAEEEYVVGTA